MNKLKIKYIDSTVQVRLLYLNLYNYSLIMIYIKRYKYNNRFIIFVGLGYAWPILPLKRDSQTKRLTKLYRSIMHA